LKFIEVLREEVPARARVVKVKEPPGLARFLHAAKRPWLARFLHAQKNASRRKNIFLAENQTGAQTLSEAL